VAAPGDDVELGAVDLGDDVALHQLDGLDPVVLASKEEHGNVDPVQVEGSWRRVAVRRWPRARLAR
jgi:hypothetical protein